MFNCEVRSNWKKGRDITWKGNFQGYESGERGTILDIYEHKYLKYSSIDPNFGIEDKAENYLHISYDIESLGGKTILITTIENFNGDPKRLEHVSKKISLKLIKTKAFSAGTVILYYERL